MLFIFYALFSFFFFFHRHHGVAWMFVCVVVCFKTKFSVLFYLFFILECFKITYFEPNSN